jgi:hydroxymethylpyrimidine pyrophosphatase-like HAD family hydrolase
MRYHVVACDYDGTLALHGRVDEPTIRALERLRESGRRLVLVTGRELPDLSNVFPRLDLFERVVAENGALLYRPDTREATLQCAPASQELGQLLRERGVSPVSVGRGIVATWEPHQETVLEAIHDLGLELQVIFNKGAVMVLPSGVNKASGLQAALEELSLSVHNAVGIGDAENDHALLTACECGVAVANAVPALKQTADWVTRQDHGAGVVELTERLIESDLTELEARLAARDIVLGVDDSGEPVRVSPYGVNVLLAGASGSGKSTLATAFLERLKQAGYQFCIVDPEGDYERLEDAVVLGDGQRYPSAEEALAALEKPSRSVVVSLLALSRENRPRYFESMLPRLQQMRARTGRPHWILVDETHHLLPVAWDPAALTLPQDMHSMMFITVHPDHVSAQVLGAVDLVITVGASAKETLETFARTLGRPLPAVEERPMETGEVLAWLPDEGTPFRFQPITPHAERKRHLRKYAEGDLGPDRSFHFRGPDGRLNLKAQNLTLFLQIAEGVDDETWLHHLRQGDYSRWFRDKIKDPALADETQNVENQPDLSAQESRTLIREFIEQRYAAPA